MKEKTNDGWRPARTPEGVAYGPSHVQVLFVAFHRSYTRAGRDYDVAVLGELNTRRLKINIRTRGSFRAGTKWNIQFSTYVQPLCLPDVGRSDGNSCKGEHLTGVLKTCMSVNFWLEPE